MPDHSPHGSQIRSKPAPLPQLRLKPGRRARRIPVRARAYAIELVPGLPVDRFDEPQPQLRNVPIAALGIGGPWGADRPDDEEDGDGCGDPEK
ncbi:hypothetical protein [Streptomyces sp. NPDC048361]|uniref:hypothetical protein n=1 Tax=Streptomyces sp. NPDC048361 TaxID=3154720 RepID=UPI003429454C